MKDDIFKNMCDIACYGIIRLNKNGVIEYTNDFACNLLDIDKVLLKDQQSIIKYIPEQQHKLYSKIFNIYPDIIKDDQQANEGFLEPTHIEFEKPAPNKTMAILLKLSFNPLYQDNHLCGYCLWINDITRRKKLLTQLDQAEKLASLATLASGIAHHFNNIIGGVATFSDYALSTNNPQIHHRALNMTIEAADRISGITSSLLTFAEQDSREFEKSDLSETIHSFVHLVEKKLCDQNITLQLQMDCIPRYQIPGTKIHQVLNNIVKNAQEAMPDGGTFSIKLFLQGDYIILACRDTGCGIDPDHLPHIFNPFFTTRGVACDGDASHNHGLGLSVVYGIINELKGTINAKSQIDRGTEFIIKFPINR